MLVGQRQRRAARERHVFAVQHAEPGGQPLGVGQGRQQITVVAASGCFACLPPGAGKARVAEYLLELARQQFVACASLHMRQNLAAVILVDRVGHQQYRQVRMPDHDFPECGQAFRIGGKLAQPVHMSRTPVEDADLAGRGKEKQAMVYLDHENRSRPLINVGSTARKLISLPSMTCTGKLNSLRIRSYDWSCACLCRSSLQATACRLFASRQSLAQPHHRTRSTVDSMITAADSRSGRISAAAPTPGCRRAAGPEWP